MSLLRYWQSMFGMYINYLSILNFQLHSRSPKFKIIRLWVSNMKLNLPYLRSLKRIINRLPKSSITDMRFNILGLKVLILNLNGFTYSASTTYSFSIRDCCKWGLTEYLQFYRTYRLTPMALFRDHRWSCDSWNSHIHCVYLLAYPHRMIVYMQRCLLSCCCEAEDIVICCCRLLRSLYTWLIYWHSKSLLESLLCCCQEVGITLFSFLQHACSIESI